MMPLFASLALMTLYFLFQFVQASEPPRAAFVPSSSFLLFFFSSFLLSFFPAFLLFFFFFCFFFFFFFFQCALMLWSTVNQRDHESRIVVVAIIAGCRSLQSFVVLYMVAASFSSVSMVLYEPLLEVNAAAD